MSKKMNDLAVAQSEKKQIELDPTNPLIMRTKTNWYSIESVIGIPIVEQAKHHGELNDHIMSVETRHGDVLWERIIH